MMILVGFRIIIKPCWSNRSSIQEYFKLNMDIEHKEKSHNLKSNIVRFIFKVWVGDLGNMFM